ncbi:uncharacterized protein METZ01_LOCUS296876, partial [marine metagenome]
RTAARNVFRPMRPKPLMAIRADIAISFWEMVQEHRLTKH